MCHHYVLVLAEGICNQLTISLTLLTLSQKPLDITSTEVVNLGDFDDVLHLLLFEHKTWDLIEGRHILLAPVVVSNKTRIEEQRVGDNQESINNYTNGSEQPDLLATRTDSSSNIISGVPAPENTTITINEANPTWSANTRNATDGLKFTPTDGTNTPFPQHGFITLQGSDHLPCGLHFDQTIVLTRAELEALNGAMKAYRCLGGTNDATAKPYHPILVGPHVGPDLGILGASASGGLGLTWAKLLRREDVPCTRDSRAPFQRQSNIAPYQDRRKHRRLIMLDFMAEREISFLILIPLSMLYGGLHTIAWNYHFPSSYEQLFWKLSSGAVVLQAIIVVGIAYSIREGAVFDSLRRVLTLYKNDIWGRNEPLSYGTVRDIMKWLQDMINFSKSVMPDVMASINIGVYILGRVFLVVESFVSLRSVPIGVYLTPGWLQMIPHL